MPPRARPCRLLTAASGTPSRATAPTVPLKKSAREHSRPGTKMAALTPSSSSALALVRADVVTVPIPERSPAMETSQPTRPGVTDASVRGHRRRAASEERAPCAWWAGTAHPDLPQPSMRDVRTRTATRRPPRPGPATRGRARRDRLAARLRVHQRASSHAIFYAARTPGRRRSGTGSRPTVRGDVRAVRSRRASGRRGAGGVGRRRAGRRGPPARRAAGRRAASCARWCYYKRTRRRWTMLQAAWLRHQGAGWQGAELKRGEAAPLGARAARQRLQPDGG